VPGWTSLRGAMWRQNQSSMAERGEGLRTVPEVMAKNRMTAEVVDSASWDLQVDPVCLKYVHACGICHFRDLRALCPESNLPAATAQQQHFCLPRRRIFGSMADCKHAQRQGLHISDTGSRDSRAAAAEHLPRRHGAAHQKLKFEMRCRAAPVASVSTGSSGPLLKGACGVPTCWICGESDASMP